MLKDNPQERDWFSRSRFHPTRSLQNTLVRESLKKAKTARVCPTSYLTEPSSNLFLQARWLAERRRRNPPYCNRASTQNPASNAYIDRKSTRLNSSHMSISY